MLAPVLRQSTSAYTTSAFASSMLPHGAYHQSMNLPNQNLHPRAHDSQYALQQLQHPPSQLHHASTAEASPSKIRHHPYDTGAFSATGGGPKNNLSDNGSKVFSTSSTPVRRRISRACDQCNQLRTKCDGKSPCAHCIEFNLTCEYARERKKRGKASRKELAQQQAAAVGLVPTSPNDFSSDSLSPIQTSRDHGDAGGYMSFSEPGSRPVSTPRSMSLGSNVSGSTGVMSNDSTTTGATSLGNQQEIPSSAPVHAHHLKQPHHHIYSNSPDGTEDQLDLQSSRHRGGVAAIGPVNLALMRDYAHLPPAPPGPNKNGHEQIVENAGCQSSSPSNFGNDNSMPSYATSPYSLLGAQVQHNPSSGLQLNSLAQSSMSGYMGGTPTSGCLGWPSSPPSSAAAFQNQQHHLNLALSPRYPVLQPLIPYIGTVLPMSLACDLLEFFFVDSSSAPTHPLSPYILGLVFRKRSVLHPTRPRKCSPALLASMLWVAAQTSNAAFLSSPPAARGTICQKLMELTVGLLKPLIHGSPGSENGAIYNSSSDTSNNGVNIGGFGIPPPGGPTGQSSIHPDENPAHLTGSLDDVATYINLATVISASEHKAASLRWWNSAWSLARELKLGRELPTTTSELLPVRAPGYMSGSRFEVNHGHNLGVDLAGHGLLPSGDARYGMAATSSPPCSEEVREERRRIWWLLYIVDRHLALCYNRPLFLLDVECDSLLQPVDDNIWQAGDSYDDTFNQYFANPESIRYRKRGSTFECTGHSIFGYFLPLMSILGEIVDLNNARNHPRFGLGFRSAEEWDDQASDIAQQLDNYGRSLEDFELRWRTQSGAATPSSASMTECTLQTKVVVAYGTYVMHVLYILLDGKWDPISLLVDNDQWTSSHAFMTATQHAVAGAAAVSDILYYDPDLSFMPFFFGIYLLQGSFLLLSSADKLQGEASPGIVKACETIVRAHEACVVTSNAEYQSNIRKVMRSALAQVRGLIPDDLGELRARRREVLAPYRWTAGGSGFAV